MREKTEREIAYDKAVDNDDFDEMIRITNEI